MLCRLEQVHVDPCILSSYGPGGRLGVPRYELRPQRAVGSIVPGADVVPADVAQGLLALHHAIGQEGGDFRILDLVRTIESQSQARRKYLRWLDAGKPSRSDARWDAEHMKDAYVARPGRSTHNAGRAVDIEISALSFPGVPADCQLDALWDIARPLGWTPIIKAPWEQASEAWHFDFWGEWAPVRDRLGYAAAAMAAVLDIGKVDLFPRGVTRALQAQLHRAGYDVGDIDGWMGDKTIVGVQAAGLDPDDNVYALATESMKLPSSHKLHFTA